MDTLTADELSALRAWPTPAIANAVETFDVRPRNTGFMLGIRCLFPDLGATVGYAATARIRAAVAPDEDPRPAMLEHWKNVAAQPAPRLAVIQDLDAPRAVGAFWGEVNASVHRALGCVGVVTDGGVRDLEEVRALGFHMFAAEVLPSHAYVHVVDVGREVRVGGLAVRDGDLLHADRHGVVHIPQEIARELPRACAQVEKTERRIIEFCRSAEFSVEGLAARLARMA